MKFDRWGNRLYTGETSYDIVGRRRTWYVLAAVVLLISVGALLVRGLNLGIDFTGGAEFRVSEIQGEVDESLAADAVEGVLGTSEVQATGIGDDSVRVRTGEVTTAQSDEIADALAEVYDVAPDVVTSSFIGPSWGQQVSQRALQGLVVFLVLVAGVITVYFRTWKMALAAMVALMLDMVFTVGTYSLSGLEVTPSTVIGFLTILGYSLYDTVVVFDKVRENIDDAMEGKTQTFAEAANLAINQTLVRSINTSVVALLPVAAVLVIGVGLLGASTLLDLALVLFIGIAVGTFSSVFIATPLLVHLRQGEKAIVAHDRKVLQRRERQPVLTAPALADPDDRVLTADRRSATERALGQRSQPKRPPRSRR